MRTKLEAGKHYKTRGGEKVLVIRSNQKENDPWPFMSHDKKLYFKNGGFSCRGAIYDRDDSEDIISEWHEPESSGVDALHGYEKLESILNDAFLQSSGGKGHERHGMGLPFNRQRMQTISQLIDSDAGMEFQAIKKLTEGLDMENHEARRRELLGVIVYVAGIILYHDEKAKANG